jgi:hypothetical protein
VFHTGSEIHSVSYAVGTRVLSWGQSGRFVKMTTEFHLLRLRMSGDKLLLPPVCRHVLRWDVTFIGPYFELEGLIAHPQLPSPGVSIRSVMKTFAADVAAT